MKKYIIAITALVITMGAAAQRSFELPLWKEGQCQDADYQDARLYCYIPDVAGGKAILACPGGAYQFLAMDHEGKGFAPILNKEGIALFVLKYRLPHGRYTVPLADAEQAMRIIRSHAKEWGIEQVGVMGSSAGGHLASTLATHYSDSSVRPDFQVLLYPVVTMQDNYTHKGSQEALLGKDCSQTLKNEYSNELKVTKDTPKAFIALSSADDVVVPPNTFQYAQAMIDNKVPVNIHMYEGGYHGWGCHRLFSEYEQWIGELLHWLKK